jgi:hypothetical protein
MATNRVGLDIGTYSIVSVRKNGDDLENKKEINAFFELPVTNQFMVNMLKQTGVPMIEVDKSVYVLGQKALELALSMGKEYRRPMKNGVVSQNEKEAFNILAVIIRSMIGQLETDDTIVYYSVPANAVNTETNADYHQKVLQAILDKYTDGTKRIRAFPLNEAQAIVYAEAQDEQMTAIGVSCGGGMVNSNYSIFGVPIFKFSHTNAGDWIDEQAAKSCGESVAFINNAKKDVDLSAEPKNSVERAIIYNYQIMIENAIKSMVDGVKKAGTRADAGKPVPIIVAGGTAMPKGFIEFFKKVFSAQEFPIPIKEIRLAEDPIHTVAKGCFIAALMHRD